MDVLLVLEIGTVYPSRAHGFTTRFFEGSVLLILLVFLLWFFVCLRFVSGLEDVGYNRCR